MSATRRSGRLSASKRLAQYLERYGDCRVVRIDEITPRQMSIHDAVSLDVKTGEWTVKK